MSIQNAQQTITSSVSRWDGIEVRPHRFGGVEYGIGRREIGHIHGNHQVDIPFPKRVREELVANGEADLHHILPESGWITLRIRKPQDVSQAVKLLRRSYELALKQKSRKRDRTIA